MKNQIIIELSNNDSQLMCELRDLHVPVNKYDGKHFGAETLCITLIISVLPTAITQITSIIVAAIQRNKDIKIKYRGVEIQGLSKKDIYDILERISLKDIME